MTLALTRALTLLSLVSLLLATAAEASDRDWRTWAEAASQQHVLAGRVYDVAQARLAPPAGGLVLPEGFVLLGETHDNPAHHRVRAWLIADALRARPHWRPAVVFEQIDTGQQAALDQLGALATGAGPPPKADDLFRLLQWEKSGWPAAATYQPLFETVIAGRLPILAGNPPRERVRAVARGVAPLDPGERARLRLDAPLPAPLAEALSRELAASHCGALPPQAIGGMAMAQRYRDAYLADALLAGAERHGSAILIAGNGHVRSDRGVPWHIRERVPGAPVTSVLLVEVEAGKTEPADYVPRDPDGKPAADLVIFTPRAERTDPCLSLLEKKK
jgi:uncharacterized iron-regulated protein